MRIAFQGEPGAYSEAAALRFSRSRRPAALRVVRRRVRRRRDRQGHARHPAGRELDRRQHPSQLRPAARARPADRRRGASCDITHNLLALPGTPLEQVKRIYSHPQALAQCERFLRSLPGVAVEATYDTAGSAKLIKEQELTDAAAIASERAAAGLRPRDPEARDPGLLRQHHALPARQPHGRLGPAGRQDDRRLLAAERAGRAVQGAVSVFALRDIDLTKLESRPIRGRPWEYLFYVDLPVGRHDLRCARALVHLAEFARSMRTLGSYPSWKGRDAAQPGVLTWRRFPSIAAAAPPSRKVRTARGARAMLKAVASTTRR